MNKFIFFNVIIKNDKKKNIEFFFFKIIKNKTRIYEYIINQNVPVGL